MKRNVYTQFRYLLPVTALIILMAGIASATIHTTGPKFDGVNIFENTKNDCEGLRWQVITDSANLTFPVKVDGELFFAGERVPLEDPEVKERLERELQLNAYWHSNTLTSMKLANRYFGQLEEILTQNGVPADFKYMPLIESGFRNDVSPSGAVGFWQIMKGTAATYNLEVNGEVDERYNIEKSTLAACRYLTDAKNKFGSWTTAAASYNMGMGGMANRIQDQKTSNFYDMYFNPETSRYIFRMLAMKIIFSNPQIAGFLIDKDDLYQPYIYKTVEIDSSIPNIADFAAGYGLKYKHIKILNTWLREARLTNKEHKKYSIKVLELN
ncbi:MAG: lytic transglycosylase domain-containing protein [Chitinophagales bacterium]